MTAQKKRAIIIGAGPAGLTAAYELLQQTSVEPVVLEATGRLGGISTTVNYKGNRIDIGGHRFFSKSDRVMQWWLRFVPLQEDAVHENPTLTYQNQQRRLPENPAAVAPADADNVMLVCNRKSRIFFRRKLFDYPLAFSVATLSRLGLGWTLRVGASYCRSSLFPVKPEQNLEHFFINRFGRRLYRTFFQSYTEKVWGVPCNQISADWGAQRIKGLSIRKTLQHFIRKQRSRQTDLAQKQVETSLIEKFLYPKLGPGQLWENVARDVQAQGGTIRTSCCVTGIHVHEGALRAVTFTNEHGESETLSADYVLSTMPVKELVRALNVEVPQPIRQISEGLLYRDFFTVGLLLKKLKLREPDGSPIKDNWIYLQEPDVHAGRLQIFNNWSTALVADPSLTWVGVEYFCNEHDALWQQPDAKLKQLAADELQRLGIIDATDVIDATLIRMPKTYPAYFGTYNRFDELRRYLDLFPNLFLIGRNGMHKYNNQDHSMLTAMTAVENIQAGRTDKSNIWAVNTEQEYHEER